MKRNEIRGNPSMLTKNDHSWNKPSHFQNDKRLLQACSAAKRAWGYQYMERGHLYELIFGIVPYWY